MELSERTMIPSTEPAQRLATLFKRRSTTPWSDKEIKQYKRLFLLHFFDDNLEGLDLIERYYVYQRKKGDLGIHRRDLYTFLNNFAGELDRARAWDEAIRAKQRLRTHINNGNGQKPVDDNEFKRIGDLARSELAALREKMRVPQ